MQMGYNTDIDHHGVTVHIQTEDHGLGDSKITTQVFFSGRILDSRTISYAEAITGQADEDARDTEITKRMRAIHRHFLNRIREGAYDAKLPIVAGAGTLVQPIENASEPAADLSLTGELTALQEEELLSESFLDGTAPLEEEVSIERLLNFEGRAWRGYDNDFSTDLGSALRGALGV